MRVVTRPRARLRRGIVARGRHGGDQWPVSGYPFARGRRDAGEHWGDGDRDCGRSRHRRGPRGAAGCLPRSRHPGQQQRRSAVSGLPQARSRGAGKGRGDEHADADSADSSGDRRHVRARVRTDRQYHVGHGQDADRGARPVQRGARGLDRVSGRCRAVCRRQGRDHHPPNSARPAPSCAAPMPVTSRARTCWSMAACFAAHSDPRRAQ